MVSVSEINALVSSSIPILSGDLNANIRSEVSVFISCCEKVNECVKEAEEKTTLLQLIGTRIRGRAAEALEGTTCDSLDSLKKILNEKLLRSRPYQVLRGELQTLYQYPGETIENFGNRLQNLLKECKEAVVGDANSIKAIQKDLEEQALYIFKAGINNTNLRWFCLSDNEKSLTALLEKAIKIEATERQINCSNRFASQSQNTFSTPNTTNNNPVNTFTQNLNQNPNTTQNTNNFGSTQFNSGKNLIKCNFCGKNGHYYTDCRTRKNTPYCTNCKLYGHTSQYCEVQNKSPPNSQKDVQMLNTNGKNRKRTFCDFCKRRSHTIDTCTIKKEWEGRNGEQPSEN